MKVKDLTYRDPDFTKEQRLVVDVMKNHGYNVNIVKVENENRFGIGASNEENDAPIITYHIKVMW